MIIPDESIGSNCYIHELKIHLAEVRRKERLFNMEERFFETFIHCYFIAFGVVIGGSIIGSIGAFVTGNAALTEIGRIAVQLRIWAIVAAIGGTFDAIANFERGIYDGSTMDLFKQALFILSAMGGVKTAILLLNWLTQEDIA